MLNIIFNVFVRIEIVIVENFFIQGWNSEGLELKKILDLFILKKIKI